MIGTAPGTTRVTAAALTLLAAPALADCAGTEGACEVPSGEYHIAMPEAPGPVPALVFLHGWGSSGEGTMRMRLDETAAARGWAVIAPDGLPRGEGRTGGSWAFHPDRREGSRDEAAFLREVVADAVETHGVDPDRVVLGGFSIGGSMASYVACEDPDAFAAYVPVGGSFWQPHPQGCEGPVRLLHTHGWQDGTVPLEGRPLGSGFVQGDVFDAMRIWRETNGCEGLRADRFPADDGYLRRAWDECAPGTALELAIFDGGHGVPDGWTEMALDWFEGLSERS